MPMGETVPRLPVRFSGSKTLSKNWQNIVGCELRVFELLLGAQGFIDPRFFLRNRLKIEIYTDAFARAPFGKDSTNWESVIGIGGILGVSGKVEEFHH